MNKKLGIFIFSIVIILALIFCLLKIHSGDSETINNVVTIEEVQTEEIPDGSTISEEELEVETFEEENSDLVSGSSNEIDESDFVVGSSLSQAVYYSQLDSRWKNIMYSSVGNKSQTIGTSGCGPTSAAMVVSSIKGVVYPNEMASLYVKYGFRSASNGTYASAFQWTAERYGIEFSRVYNVNDAINLVRNGYMVVVSCSNGLFTTGGHYIVLVNIDGDTLTIFDPYLYNGKFDNYGRSGKVTVSGNTVYCSTSNFINYANSKGYFGFKTEGNSNVTPTPSTNSKYTVGDRVLIDIPIQIAYQGSTNPSDNSLVDSNGYQFWVKNSVIINNHVYGLGTVCYDGGTVDIVQIFEEQFWCNEIYMSDIPTTSTTTQATTSSSSYTTGNYKATSNLNVRSGPGTNYKIKKTYKKGTVFTALEINGDWARTPSGWVNLKYAVKK